MKEVLSVLPLVLLGVVATLFTFFPKVVRDFQLRSGAKHGAKRFIESDRFLPFARLLGFGFYVILIFMLIALPG